MVGLVVERQRPIHNAIETGPKISDRLPCPIPLLHMNTLESGEIAPFPAKEGVINSDYYIRFLGDSVLKIRKDRFAFSVAQIKVVPCFITGACISKGYSIGNLDEVKNHNYVIDVQAQVASVGDLEGHREGLGRC